MIRTPSIGRIFLVQLSSYPSYVLVVGLWGGPYLTHIYGYDLKGRGDILFVAALTQVLGSFFWGPSDRIFGRYKLPILIGTATSFIVARAARRRSARCRRRLLLFVFALIGFSTGMTSVVMSHGRSLVPPHLLGRTITLLNIGTMGGGFLVQFVSGAVIDLFPDRRRRLSAGGLSAGVRPAGGARPGRRHCLFRQSGEPLRPLAKPCAGL